MFNPAMPPVESSSLLDRWPPGASEFPILTLDERALAPALGYIFRAEWVDPFESLISILWKFKKANSLPGHVVARLMGLETDPYEGAGSKLKRNTKAYKVL